MELHIPMPMHQLGLFGRVEHFWTPNETERALHNLPLGSFFRFAFYQHCQDAVRVCQPALPSKLTVANLIKGASQR